MTSSVAELRQLSDDQLSELYCAAVSADADTSAYLAECERRDRSSRARAATRRRHSEWEAAAYAQYEQAEAYCRGNMLSAAGKRRGRDAWPMCWEGSEETARKLASDELVTYWDYVSPRVPGPGQYAAAKRAAAAEHEARSEPAPEQAAPRVVPVPTYRPAVVPVPSYRPPSTAVKPGSIARYITALGALERQALQTARALESYPKSSVKGTK